MGWIERQPTTKAKPRGAVAKQKAGTASTNAKARHSRSAI